MTREPDARDTTGLSRRQLIVTGGVGGIALAAAPGVASAARSGLPIVHRGMSRMVVVVSDEAGTSMLAARDALVDYVEQATGVRLQTASLPSNPPPDDAGAINLGVVGPGTPAALVDEVAGLDPSGFAIVPHGRSMTILGPTEWGSINGTHDFITSAVGVEWLMPTEEGTHVPQLSTIRMPAEKVIKEPDFPMRMISPFVNEPHVSGTFPADLYRWAARHRLQGWHNNTYDFHHNLFNFFPVSEFGESHPEYYAFGRPPAPGVTVGWQPAFTNPDTIDVAVTKIKAWFAANPESNSISLGVNDSAGFEEPEPSDPYYAWVNAVVERVLQDLPDKWFGLLAYEQLEVPPTFPLHPRVVPFFTQDRYSWIDPEVAAASKARLAAWGEVASQIGWYDYSYGSPYLVPRIFNRHAAEVLRYAKEHNVVAHYQEMYPNWGEGPKPWLTARLMWDVNLDVDAELDRWYELAVGPKAAPYLKQFYELWEEIWTQHAWHTSWFQQHSTYQAFTATGYLDAVPLSKVAEAQALIDQVWANKGTRPQTVRAARLRTMFEYYYASAMSCPRDVPPPQDTEAAIAMLADVETSWQQLAQLSTKRLALIRTWRAYPLLRHPSEPEQHGLIWEGWNPSKFWGVVDHLTSAEPDGGPVTDWLTERRNGPANDFTTYVALTLDVAAGVAPTVIRNGSFEDGAALWDLWIASAGTLVPTTEVAHDGERSLLVRHLLRGGPAQFIPLKPGMVAFRGHLRAPGDSYRATVQVGLNLRDATGRQQGRALGNIIPLHSTGDGWVTVDALFSVPTTINDVPIVEGQYVFILDGFDTDPDAYVDSIAGYQPRGD
ncbi:DUF4838 domain-containing protein [Microlunatus sp. Y2014]|uniref:DUF4838 domain-containing protein n=1 Tax=Microlunatus sp. Y2014 TaxID=3418488 RepID=UPI003DA789E9